MGVHPKRIVYQATISRWGACNKTTGVIKLSLYLLLLPEWCVEHVVVHELAHLIEANHGPRFHALLEEVCPGHRNLEKQLRTYKIR